MSAGPAVPPQIDVALAERVIEATKRHGIFRGAEPTTPEEFVVKANEMYQLALQAKAGGMGEKPAIVEVLGIVEGTPVAAPGAVPAPAAPVDNPFAGPSAPAPAAAPAGPPTASVPPQAAPPAAPPAAPAPPVAAPAPAAPVQIVEKATGQIFELPADQPAEPYIASGQYDLVASATPVAPPAAPQQPEPVAAPPQQAAPAAAPSGVPAIDPSQYASVEPWTGYTGQNIAPIMEQIQQVAATQDADTLRRVLGHVWAYESGPAGKGRKQLLKKLTELSQGGGEAQAPATPPVVPGEGADVQPAAPFAGVPAPAAPGVPPAAPAPGAVPAAPAPAAAPTSAPLTTQFPQQPVYQVDPSTGLIAPLADGTTQKSEAAIRAANLPIPVDIQGDPPVLPQDFSQLAANQIAWYASQFTACLAVANWKGAIAEGYAADAKLVARDRLSQYKAGNPAPKGTTVDQIEAQAYAAIPEIAQAQQVQAEWSGYAKLLRELAGIYENNLIRLSREQTRLADEAAVSR